MLWFLDWRGVDWVKWFDLALWTGVVFGSVADLYGTSFDKGKCLLVFLAAFALHAAALIPYTHSVKRFPNVFFLFFSPFEGAAVVALLIAIAGARVRRIRRAPRP